MKAPANRPNKTKTIKLPFLTLTIILAGLLALAVRLYELR